MLGNAPFDIEWPRTAVFGVGSVARLGPGLRELGATRVLLASDAGLRATGLVDRVADLLRGAALGVAVDTSVSSNPREAEVEAVHALWEAEGCDAIVALGGGGTIDAVKGAILRRLTGRSLNSLFDRGIDEAPAAPIRFAAVPTTSGTGSEATLGAVLKTPRRKLVLRSPHLRPALTILDPELVVSLPPRATAATGMDALMHALGVLTSSRPHPIGNMVGMEAMRRAAVHIRRAVEDGRDIIFPHVMHVNMPMARPRYAAIARLIGAAAQDDPEEAAAERLVDHLTALRDGFGMPTRLGALGVGPEMIPELARQTALSAATHGNARPIGTEDAVALYGRMI
ncbi:1,3-propanediol dehydrogenase (plasmid) [Roseomonas mucosa]|uniref:1,3-propanediol dehydrogenase n=1 Tax=Roseomonas mucosa TaxID=207340 RepID=A0A4Y1MS66_9PROT|nr:iron-containing alcohol dehydrogenase [Roseomonas mucosa]AWV20479.1 1,3-propanediol dehydrogenase [Roseomonas mucosa]MDT8356144.1 iron-containing alcohol dehydrogenase [Roseomonas mucosa]MDU7524676.1 iron-containing alcohol dehydrogenase [Roseomonas mucosa]